MNPGMIVSLLAVALVWGMSLPGPALAAEFYVSVSGRDTDNGSRGAPFASLERARDALRDARSAGAAGGATVWIGPGNYSLTRPFDLTELDGGTAEAPVVYRALPNHGLFGGSKDAIVRFRGGREIKPGEFKPVTDPGTLARVAEAARGKIIELDLAALGIEHRQAYPDVFTDTGNLVDLFCNGVRMPLARDPNDGYMTMKRVLYNAGGVTNRNWGTSTWEDKPHAGHGGVFEFREEFLAPHTLWAGQLDRGVWFKGYWRIPWQNEAIRVAGIDLQNHTVTLAQPVAGGIGNKYTRPAGNGKEPYWVMNLLEAVDRPGEWCVDFKDQKLYFYPPRSLDQVRVVLADSSEPMIRIKGASHVILRGLTLEENLGDGIRISGGEDVLIAGCTVRNVDKYAVVVDGGRNHTVLSCDLYNLGEGGVSLAGGDDRVSPRVSAGHRVVNNHIHHFSQITRIYTPGVRCGYVNGGTAGHFPAVGMLVAHNLIHDTPHAGLLHNSYDSIFEYNEIFRFALVSNDIGGFYSFENDALDGNRTFRFNLVHHSGEGDGIYFDNAHKGMKIYGNIVCLEGTGAGLIFKDGGQDKSPPQYSEVTNNIFMRCGRGGLVFSPSAGSNLIKGNLLVQCASSWDWRELENGKWKRVRGYQPPGNAVYAKDPGFVNAVRLDFRLKPGSPVWKALPGFEPIPVQKIGLFVDEYRKRLPTDREVNRFSCTSGEAGIDEAILDRD